MDNIGTIFNVILWGSSGVLLLKIVQIRFPGFLANLGCSFVKGTNLVMNRMAKELFLTEDFNSQIQAIYQDLKEGDAEMIVSTQQFGLSERIESRKIKFGIPLGSTIAVYTGPRCNCQHVISLSEISVQSISRDSIDLIVPKPRLNQQTIELDVSAEVNVSVGYLRFSACSGQTLRRTLRRSLRERAIEKLSMDSASYILVAKLFARKKVEEIMKDNHGFKYVNIVFKDEITDERSGDLLKLALRHA
ncbi:MAG: hypothetical protein KC478_10330 [Bacteriovoracaceae bacterium]|nr:hypothetical protein [Bacteriovoracaceae bacterium]